MTPDRHLGYATVKLMSTVLMLIFTFAFFRSAWIDKCQPELLITESTYATTIRDSKRLSFVLEYLYPYIVWLECIGPVV